MGEIQAQLSADAVGVSWPAFQSNPQARPGLLVVEEPGFVAVFGYDEVDPTVAIIVAEGGSALFAIDLYAGILTRHRDQFAVSAAA
jgi:hypothetical protein